MDLSLRKAVSSHLPLGHTLRSDIPGEEGSRVPHDGGVRTCKGMFADEEKADKGEGVAGKTPCPGMTLLETLVVVAMVATLSAISIPLVSSSLKTYHLSAASTAVAGAIRSTRYLAIMNGCPYNIAFTLNSTSYQVANEPASGTPPTCATTFSNVGGGIPWSNSGDVSISASTTLQFAPNGIVTATAGSLSFANGSLSFTLSNGARTNTITLSGAGNVKVTNP